VLRVLPDGAHTWSVTASNPAGLTRSSSEAMVWVDTVKPVITLALTGTKQVGSRLRAHVTYTDAPPPEPRRAASGVSAVEIRWGDRSRFHIAHWSEHAFKRAGHYTITVIVKDAAGNRSTLTKAIQIKLKPKPKPKRGKTKPKSKTKTGGTTVARRR
jgi:PKD repeat protein